MALYGKSSFEGKDTHIIGMRVIAIREDGLDAAKIDDKESVCDDSRSGDPTLEMLSRGALPDGNTLRVLIFLPVIQNILKSFVKDGAVINATVDTSLGYLGVWRIKMKQLPLFVNDIGRSSICSYESKVVASTEAD